MLPNTLGPVIVAITFGIPLAIFAEAVLGFIGFGLRTARREPGHARQRWLHLLPRQCVDDRYPVAGNRVADDVLHLPRRRPARRARPAHAAVGKSRTPRTYGSLRSCLPLTRAADTIRNVVFGAVAQSGERNTGSVEVGGSNPPSSTKIPHRRRADYRPTLTPRPPKPLVRTPTHLGRPSAAHRKPW